MGGGIGGAIGGALGAVGLGVASEAQRSKGIRRLRSSESDALDELNRSYQGPLEGLRLAPEFFRLLSSGELAGTPLAGALALQNQLQKEALGGLTGDTSFAAKLPKDLEASIGEGLSSQLGALGIETSPSAAIQAALKYSGGSEAVRQNRINSALAVLNQTGGAAIYPSSQDFLDVGANLALNKAKVRSQSDLAFSNLYFQRAGQYAGLAGQALTGGAGASGLFGGPGGFAGAGQFLGLSQPSQGQQGQGMQEPAGPGQLPQLLSMFGSGGIF